MDDSHGLIKNLNQKSSSEQPEYKSQIEAEFMKKPNVSKKFEDYEKSLIQIKIDIMNEKDSFKEVS